MLARCPYEFRPLVAGRRARGSYAPRGSRTDLAPPMSAEIAAFAASVQNPGRIEGIRRISWGEDRGERPTRPLRLVRDAVAVRAGLGRCPRTRSPSGTGRPGRLRPRWCR